VVEGELVEVGEAETDDEIWEVPEDEDWEVEFIEIDEGCGAETVEEDVDVASEDEEDEDVGDVDELGVVVVVALIA
jgi:hypothetical protein